MSDMSVWVDIGGGSSLSSVQVRVKPNWSILQLKEAVFRYMVRMGNVPRPPWVVYDHVVSRPAGIGCLVAEDELGSTLASHGIRANDHVQMIIRIANFDVDKVLIWSTPHKGGDWLNLRSCGVMGEVNSDGSNEPRMYPSPGRSEPDRIFQSILKNYVFFMSYLFYLDIFLFFSDYIIKIGV